MYVLKKTKKPAAAAGSSSSSDPTKVGSSSSNSGSGSGRHVKGEGPKGPQPCGCMATRHRFVGSCIACGRIKCDAENKLPNCPFCGTLIVKPMSAEGAAMHGFDGDAIKAYQQKDKLLQFDKEHAKRTHVHDAQGDYYESGTWLTESEKAAVNKKEEMRKKLLQLQSDVGSGKRSAMFSLDMKAGKLVARPIDLAAAEEELTRAETGNTDVEAELLTSGYQETISCAGPALSLSTLSAAAPAVVAPEQGRGAEATAAAAAFTESQLQSYQSASNIDNDILVSQQSKAGDVYRLLRAKAADASNTNNTNNDRKRANNASRGNKPRFISNDNSDIIAAIGERTRGNGPNRELAKFCRLQHDFDVL